MSLGGSTPSWSSARAAGVRAATATSGSTCSLPRVQLELAADPLVALWDLAAPKIIVQEAGGQFTNLAWTGKGDGVSGLASNGRLHDAARTILEA